VLILPSAKSTTGTRPAHLIDSQYVRNDSVAAVAASCQRTSSRCSGELRDR